MAGNGNDGPKEICCCGAYSWAKAIGVIQIILYTFSMGFLIFLLIMLGLVSSGSNAAVNAYQTNTRVPVGPIIFGVLGLLCSIIGIITGVLLIKGANQSNTRYLTIWMYFAAVCFGWKIIEACLSNQPIGVNITSLALAAAMYGFGLWSVFVLKREIEAGTLSPWAAARRGNIFPMSVVKA